MGQLRVEVGDRDARPAGPAPGRRAQRKHATRRELLLAGRTLFGTRGLYESRVEDLTSSAGIAKGTLYQYFRSKEELVEAVVGAGLDDLHGRLSQAARGARTLTDAVERVVAAHVVFFVENPDLLRILHQVRGLLKFDGHPGLAILVRRQNERLADILAVVPEGARMPATRRRTLAALLSGGVSGLCSTLAVASPGRPLHAVAIRAAGLGFAAMAVSLNGRRRGPRARAAGRNGR